MDGPHDVGGKDSYGAIDSKAAPFDTPWEERQWALSRTVPIRAGTIDWWRHGIETMHPINYLTMPYFAKWNVNDIAQGVDAGIFTMDEVLNGPTEIAPPAKGRSLDELETIARVTADFSRPMNDAPAFDIGAQVLTNNTPTTGHTRLPAYARGKIGRIIKQHGGHLFPDDGALGIEKPQHLYTVEFSARTLWGDTASATDTVCIDLWESYLGHA